MVLPQGGMRYHGSSVSHLKTLDCAGIPHPSNRNPCHCIACGRSFRLKTLARHITSKIHGERKSRGNLWYSLANPKLIFLLSAQRGLGTVSAFQCDVCGRYNESQRYLGTHKAVFGHWVVFHIDIFIRRWKQLGFEISFVDSLVNFPVLGCETLRLLLVQYGQCRWFVSGVPLVVEPKVQRASDDCITCGVSFQIRALHCHIASDFHLACEQKRKTLQPIFWL